MIQPIVEGDGEVTAVPLLLRRLRDEAQVFELEIGNPIKRKRSQLVREATFVESVEIARRQPRCSSILVIFDGDDDCPLTLMKMLQGWAATVTHVPCAVVVANREYEAWFLGSLESLRGRRGVRHDARTHPDPERPRDAKGELERMMNPGTSYHAPADQPAMTALFDMGEAFTRCRSFRRMTTAFGELLRTEKLTGAEWPPAAWMAGT